jgi:hypothetical protein
LSCVSADDLSRPSMLCRCAKLTDKGLEELARLPALTSLHLTACPKVTAKGLTALKTALPDLVVV